ncbi:winged helix-turn-helix domain-containing protein [Terasakiella pusilla]|uniref:winged helix-turn-helix domain-containing protein n=1 Tax=Terasakiella pusilla TaxID=64973 RepID=UPI003AA7E70B
MATYTPHIIIVEDDSVCRAHLVNCFKQGGYRVSTVKSAQELNELMEAAQPDLLVLNTKFAGEDGLTITREQRSHSKELGIIIITGCNDEIDRIVGLEMGADDYVTRPFNQRELLARAKNLLIRVIAQRAGIVKGDFHQFQGWSFDIPSRRLTAPDGRRVELTRAEYELLTCLVKHPGQVMSRDRLLNFVTHRGWDPSDRTIDVLVRRLRQKIEQDPKKPEIFSTAHGEGYVFTAPIE